MTRRRADREARTQRYLAENLSDLFAFAERRSTNPTDAADALGDTLEIIWRKASHIPAEPTPARMYMFGVMRNVLANSSRATRNRSTPATRLALELEQCHSPDHAQASNLSLDISRALSTLPAAQAELIRLIHWDGFTIAESAELMKINPSTARGRYAAARQSLRIILEGRCSLHSHP